MAAQERALQSQYYEHHILHRDVCATCPVCSASLETVVHLVAGCNAMAPIDYTDRHKQVASIASFTGTFVSILMLQWRARGTGIKLIGLWRWTTSLFCGIRPSPLQGRSQPTERTCLINRKANTCILNDISCPANGVIGRKHAKKLAKYGDLRVEISRMWQCRTQVVSSGLCCFGHSAHRYCTVAEH